VIIGAATASWELIAVAGSTYKTSGKRLIAGGAMSRMKKASH
jgi:hypothetical protein